MTRCSRSAAWSRTTRALRPLRIRELTVTPGDDHVDRRPRCARGGNVRAPGDRRDAARRGRRDHCSGRTPAPSPTATPGSSRSIGIGMITARGILIEAFSVLQNIAMSFTLDVDPIDPRVRAAGGRAGARRRHRRRRCSICRRGKVPPEIQMRVHLARALALGPKLLIAEHPSATLPRGVGRGLRRRPGQGGAVARPRA